MPHPDEGHACVVEDHPAPLSFAQVVEAELLSRGPSGETGTGGGGLFSGCVVMGPAPAHKIQLTTGHGATLTARDLDTAATVAKDAALMHPHGEPTAVELLGTKFIVTKCERGHVSAVSRDQEQGVIVSALPHGVLITLFRAPTTLVAAAAAVYRFVALLRS